MNNRKTVLFAALILALTAALYGHGHFGRKK